MNKEEKQIETKSVITNYFVCVELVGTEEDVRTCVENYTKQAKEGIVWGICPLENSTFRIFIKRIDDKDPLDEMKNQLEKALSMLSKLN